MISRLLLTWLLVLIHAYLNIFTVEDTLNVLLENITVTGRDGRVWQLDKVYIRGSMICCYIVPDMLRNAPMYAQSNYSSFDLTRILTRALFTVGSGFVKVWQ